MDSETELRGKSKQRRETYFSRKRQAPSYVPMLATGAPLSLRISCAVGPHGAVRSLAVLEAVSSVPSVYFSRLKISLNANFLSLEKLK